MPDSHANFAVSLVETAPSPATSGTSLVVTTGQGTLFPAVPFNATIWPVGSNPTSANAEIVRVTARTTDTLTITRAQEGTSARTVVVGDQIAATITAKTLTDVESGDFSASAGPFKVRVAAGTAPTANGALEYDSTQGALAAGGQGTINGRIPRVLSVQFSTSDSLVAATITTTETAWATQFLIPANFFNVANKLLRVTVVIDMTSSASAPTIRIRLRLQKTGPVNVNLYQVGTVTPTSSVTSETFAMQFFIQGTGAASSTANIEAGCLLQGWPGASFVSIANTVVQPVVVDTTLAQAIQMTMQFGAATAGNTYKIRQMIVEELN